MKLSRLLKKHNIYAFIGLFIILLQYTNCSQFADPSLFEGPSRLCTGDSCSGSDPDSIFISSASLPQNIINDCFSKPEVYIDNGSGGAGSVPVTPFDNKIQYDGFSGTGYDEIQQAGEDLIVSRRDPASAATSNPAPAIDFGSTTYLLAHRSISAGEQTIGIGENQFDFGGDCFTGGAESQLEVRVVDAVTNQPMILSNDASFIQSCVNSPTENCFVNTEFRCENDRYYGVVPINKLYGATNIFSSSPTMANDANSGHEFRLEIQLVIYNSEGEVRDPGLFRTGSVYIKNSIAVASNPNKMTVNACGYKARRTGVQPTDGSSKVVFTRFDNSVADDKYVRRPFYLF